MACAVAVVEDAECEPSVASSRCTRPAEVGITYPSTDVCSSTGGCFQETSNCGSSHCSLTPGCNVDSNQALDEYASSKMGCSLALKLTEDGDFQGPHDWRKRLKPVLCTLQEKPERPNSGRTLANRDTAANGVDRKFKFMDSKHKLRDYDKTCDRYDYLHNFLIEIVG